MSESRATAHAEHHREGFVRHYIFSLDHKMIGRQFLFSGLFMLIIGGLLAMMVRWQLGFPEQPIPFSGMISDEFWENQTWLPSMRAGVISSEVYNTLFTMHATIMIFFVVMPIMVGGFGNFLIPICIGARDMAFPTPQYAVLLDVCASHYFDDPFLFCAWRRCRWWLDELCASGRGA